MAFKVEPSTGISYLNQAQQASSANSTTAWNLLSYINSWSKTPSSTDTVKNKVEPKDQEPNVQTIWSNTFNCPKAGWSTSQAIFYPANNTFQKTDNFGTISVQECYPINATGIFQMTFAPSVDMLFGILDDGSPPLYNNDYWISVINQQNSGILQISSNGSKESKFHPLSTDTNTYHIVIPSCSDSQTIVVANGGLQYNGFAVWDLSSDVPKPLIQVDGYENRTFKIGNNRVIGFRSENNTGVLELWDAKSRTKTWELNDPNWFKRGGGLFFYFGPYLPEKNLLIGESGSQVYAFDIEAKKLLWHTQIGNADDILTVKHPVQDKWLVCRAASSNSVNVHSINDGKFLLKFEIGSNLKYNSDGFPMVFFEDQAIALDPKNNKQLVQIDLNTGNVDLKFEPAPHEIFDLISSGNRVMGLYHKDSKNANDKSAFDVWDIKTGKLLSTVVFDAKQYISVADVSDQILAFLITEDSDSAKKIQNKRTLDKHPKLVTPKTLKTMVKGNPIAPVNKLQFQIWNLETLTKMGTITENLVDVPDSEPMGCSFHDGSLIVNWLSSQGITFFMKNYNWVALKKAET